MIFWFFFDFFFGIEIIACWCIFIFFLEIFFVLRSTYWYHYKYHVFFFFCTTKYFLIAHVLKFVNEFFCYQKNYFFYSLGDKSKIYIAFRLFGSLFIITKKHFLCYKKKTKIQTQCKMKVVNFKKSIFFLSWHPSNPSLINQAHLLYRHFLFKNILTFLPLFFEFLAWIRRCEFSWVCRPRWTVPQIYPGRVRGKNISTGQFYIKGMKNNRSIENLLYSLIQSDFIKLKCRKLDLMFIGHFQLSQVK